MPTCRFCEADVEKLIKAHVIPRSFFKIVQGKHKNSILFEATRERLKTLFKQAGIYDSTILCEDCERLFTPWDTHGSKILAGEPSERDLYYDREGYPCGYFLKDADYHLLKLFTLSVLWRAHVSSLPFFNRVELGPHASRLREILRESKPLGAEDYSVALIYPIGQKYPDTILPPWSSKMGGVRFYRLYLPNLILLIKVDKRRTPEPFDVIQIKPQTTNLLVLQDYKGSSEDRFFEDFRRFIRTHNLLKK